MSPVRTLTAIVRSSRIGNVDLSQRLLSGIGLRRPKGLLSRVARDSLRHARIASLIGTKLGESLAIFRPPEPPLGERKSQHLLVESDLPAHDAVVRRQRRHRHNLQFVHSPSP